jgi:hypothetical protein
MDSVIPPFDQSIPPVQLLTVNVTGSPPHVLSFEANIAGVCEVPTLITNGEDTELTHEPTEHVAV